MKITRTLLIVMLAVPALAHAAGINIPNGGSMALNSGSIDLGCNDVTIAGSLDIGSGSILNTRHFNLAGGSVDAGSGQVQLAGDWTNSGTFTRGDSQVSIQDGCATTNSSLTGDTSFSDFTATSASGKTLQLAAGSSQTFYDSLTLTGVAGDPLLIRSSQMGAPAFFSLVQNGTQNIDAVDVMDNNALGGQPLAPFLPSQIDSVDAGNNQNWFVSMFVPIPTLSWPALIFLMLALMVIASRQTDWYKPSLRP